MNREDRIAVKAGAASVLSLFGFTYALRYLRVWLPPAVGGERALNAHVAAGE